MPRFDRVVVAPFDERVLGRFARVPLVVRLAHPRDVAPALALARASHLNLYRLWIDTTIPLCAIAIDDEWRDAAIALFVASAGRYREFQPQLARLRPLRIRVYLPAATAENLLAVRILASEGIRSGVIVEPPVGAWDALSELSAYALGAPGHAPIEPFAFLATHRRRGAAADYGGVYFDDPSRFLHAGADGRLAATRADLAAGRFVADSPAAAGPPLFRPPLPNGPCVACDGWPVCRGRFAAEAEGADHCRRFFADIAAMLDSIEPAA